jgi:hypothetical protein
VVRKPDERFFSFRESFTGRAGANSIESTRVFKQLGDKLSRPYDTPAPLNGR